MPYEISYDEENRLMILNFSGSPSINEHKKVRKEVVPLLKIKKYSKLLVDLSNLDTSFIKTMDNFSFGETSPQAYKGIKLAIVLPLDEPSKEDILFTSTVAFNRGLNIKEFNTVEDALSWLI